MYMFCACVTLAIVVLILFKVYAVCTLGRCTSQRKLHGKTALVTGANRGIGYYTALDLARRGARVIIASENKEGLLAARDRIIKKTGNTNVVAKYVDLLCLHTVRLFARDLLETEERLDILVNNAGTYGLGKKLTNDGLLQGMQVNYFGPFLLTNLLLGLMKKSAPSRIVNVSSVLSQIGIFFKPNDITSFNNLFNILYEDIIYFHGKRCVTYATMELADKLKGTGVTVNSLHPGAVHTNMFYETTQFHVLMLINLLGPVYFKTAEEGAQTSIHLAVSESVEGVTGKYFSDCQESHWWASKNKQIQQTIWEQSINLVKLSPDEMHYN